MQSKVASNARTAGTWGWTGFLVALATMTMLPSAFAGTVATAVLGQPDFLHGSANTVDAAELNLSSAQPGIAIDATNPMAIHVYVVDGSNNRVLGYNSIATLTNGSPADLVIGQPDFVAGSCNTSFINGAVNLCAPRGVATDSNGNVYIADATNNRVVVFSNPFTIKANTGQNAGFAAFMVFGQAGSFFSVGCNVGGIQPSASTLCSPQGVALDGSNNLWIADTSNNRVLEFSNPVMTGSMTANLVFGQNGSFTTSAPNQGGQTPSKDTLSAPRSIAVDKNNNVYIADTSNNRVLEYNTPLGSGTSAALVFGQGGDFTMATCNNASVGGLSAVSLCVPSAVGVDGSNNLYIADTNNSRIIEYLEAANPPTNRTTSNLLFGQTNATTGGCNQGGIGAATLCFPTGLAFDAAGDLFVADSNNNRALEYLAPLSSDENATLVLGHSDFTHLQPNTTDASSLSTPLQTAVDGGNHLFVADSNNNRILGWRNASSVSNGQPADLVIGQADFVSINCNQGGVGAGTLCTPSGVAVDAAGNLYVADFSNNRVLEYNTPFAACGAFPCVGAGANKVFGQGSAGTVFNQNTSNTGGSISATGLFDPVRVAIDSVGNLYVADFANNRVLEYNTPLTKTAVTGSGDVTADLVFGQGTTGGGAEFTTGDCNHPMTTVSANSLCGPIGIGTDSSNNVYVGDQTNNRVLEYNESTNATTAPSNVIANTVVGQAVFGTRGCNTTGINANSLCNPSGVGIDGSNNLFVADRSNTRVLEYFTPLTATMVAGSGDTTADLVFGQGGDFFSGNAGVNLGGAPSAATLSGPQAVSIDGTNHVYIADASNNRVLLYGPPFIPPGAQAAPAPASLRSLRLTPQQIVFAPVRVGRESRSRKIVVTNAGKRPIRIGEILSNSTEFAATNNCGTALPAHVSCDILVTFTPLIAGDRGGQVVITSDAPGGARAVSVRGRAQKAKRTR